MSRVADRQPFFRVALLCGALGLLFLGVAVRMVWDGARAVDELWAFGLGGGLSLIALAATRRGWRVLKSEALIARTRARAWRSTREEQRLYLSRGA